jgi:protein subunit release factor A
MDTITIEIRAAEGGDDAKMLVHEQGAIYAKFCRRHCL